MPPLSERVQETVILLAVFELIEGEALIEGIDAMMKVALVLNAPSPLSVLLARILYCASKPLATL